VVENNYSFTGPASIQDAADNYETLEGYHINVETGAHEEQVTFTKNLHIKGMGTNPEDTIIWTYSDEGATVTIAPETIVVMENLAIWNSGNGQAIINNGQLTLINCFVNGNYIENEVSGFVPVVEEIQEITIETESSNHAETVVLFENHQENDVETVSTMIEPDVEDPIRGHALMGFVGAEGIDTTTANDSALPLGSVASAMLMVMGGTVISGRKNK